jgi:hypothetical protein
MRKHFAFLFAFALVSCVLSAAPVVTSYFAEDDWNTALAAWGPCAQCFTESFDDSTLEPWVTITSDLPGSVSAFKWRSIVDSSPVRNDRFTPNAASVPAMNYVIGFGGNWDQDPAGFGEGMEFYVKYANYMPGAWQSVHQMYQVGSGFFGILVSGDYIRDVQVRGLGQAGVQETYSLDDFRFATCVPEPATYFLTGGMLIALAFAARQSRRS